MSNKNEFKKRVLMEKTKDAVPSEKQFQLRVQKVRSYVRKRTGAVISHAEETGALTHIRMLYSASHLLMSEANNLITEATDVATENSLISGQMKLMHQKLMRSADDYFNKFSTMFNQEDVAKYFRTLEDFDKMFREWMGITDEDIKIRIKEFLEERYGSKDETKD